MVYNPKMRIIAGTSNPALSNKISKFLKKPLTKTNIKTFADGEIYVKIEEDVRGDDVFIIQSTVSNDSIMELLIIIDAVKRASARKIIVVLPYYGYARQDRKADARESITAKLVANLITTAGADRVLGMDIHAPQIQGFFDIVFDDIWAFPIFVDYFKRKKLTNLVVVSPDSGGIKRAVFLGKRLKSPVALIDKRREKHNQVAEMNIVGEVKGKNAIIYDDIIDTGGTICKAASALKAAGARKIYLCCTHPVLSGDALSKLNASDAVEVLVTDTIPLKPIGKVKILSLSSLIGQAMKNLYENKSISILKKEIDKSVWKKWIKKD